LDIFSNKKVSSRLAINRIAGIGRIAHIGRGHVLAGLAGSCR